MLTTSIPYFVRMYWAFGVGGLAVSVGVTATGAAWVVRPRSGLRLAGPHCEVIPVCRWHGQHPTCLAPF